MTTIICNATLATMDGDQSYGLISDGAIAISGGLIKWVGPKAQLPEEFFSSKVHDVAGRLVTPALVDCHTHLVFGGNRAQEFEQRLLGATYEEVALAGGGIISTVIHTRNASIDDLVASAIPRLNSLSANGVATLEIKSGYGLDQQSEIKMLRVARKLSELHSVRIVTSFLGAHAIPLEYEGNADAYIDEVCIPTLKEACAEGLVDQVDGFCENIAFSTDQIERVFKAAKDLNLPVKLHAEQLSHQGGVALATRYRALSADHLEYATDDDAKTMAESGTVAVILPGAFYTLNETQKPPIDAFRKHQVPMAVATDANPGSSPLYSPLLAMNMACTLFRLTPEEALMGVTRNAAQALGLKNTGMIKAGYSADLAVWDVTHPSELSYTIGFNPLSERWFEGELDIWS